MDVWRITVAALRRWYIFLPLLALTGFGAVTAGQGVDPQYEVTATTILVPGPVVSDIENPYGTLYDTNQVLSIVLGATPARQTIEAQGLNPEYEASPRSSGTDFRDRSSVMNVTVLSDSQQESLATSDAVIELARQELAQRQGAAGIPADAQIGLQVLQAPVVSDVVSEGKTRIMSIVGIVGASFSLLVAVLFDDLVGLLKRWLHHWRGRKGSTRAETAPASEGVSGDESDAVGSESDQGHESLAHRDELVTKNARPDAQAYDLERTGRQP